MFSDEGLVSLVVGLQYTWHMRDLRIVCKVDMVYPVPTMRGDGLDKHGFLGRGNRFGVVLGRNFFSVFGPPKDRPDKRLSFLAPPKNHSRWARGEGGVRTGVSC